MMRKLLLLLCPMMAILPGGCSPAKKPVHMQTVEIAPGVIYERDGTVGVSLLDVDLRLAEVRPVVVAGHIRRIRSNFVGDAQTISGWAQERGGIAGINGGFFGDTYPKENGIERKQIVGLSVVEGIVTTPGSRTISTKTPGERFLRAAIGFGANGTPDISYATGTRFAGVRRYPDALDTGKGLSWNVRYAVACGPRLFARGSRKITDTEERLKSPGALPRTFAAYDVEEKQPRHLILACADAMTFEQVADYIEAIFERRHASHPHDALCLDGGGSCQMIYKSGATWANAVPNSVAVPTAILLIPKHAELPATPDQAVRQRLQDEAKTSSPN